jgi:hypothetical protein
MTTTTVRDLLRLTVTPTTLAVIAVASIHAAAGRTLGFLLGPFFAVAMILPPLVTRRVRPARALIIAAAVVGTFVIGWLVAFGGDGTLKQWLLCSIVLAAFTLALVALTRASAAWVAFVIATLWLTWPVWTSSFVTIGLANWLTPAHPLLAVNGVVRQFGVWLEQPLMYRYSALGQDVPYALPRTIWPCVMVHALAGIILLLPRASSTARSRGPVESSAAAAG